MPLSHADRRLLTDLNTCWQNLCDSRPRLPAEWTARWGCFAGVPNLSACIERPFGRSDGCLFALLSVHRAGDEVAGRIVLQSLLAGIVKMAGRDPLADLSDYVAQLWCGIQTYPLERRPRRVANNLELDTLKAVRAERPRVRLLPAGDEDLDLVRRRSERPPTPSGPNARSVIAAARDLGVLDDYTACVLQVVYAEGLSGREAAERLDTTVDLVRWRCSRAVRALARHREQLIDAA